jgi:hypothetical protein
MIKVIKKDNYTIRMHIPDLEPEERERRINEMKEATKRFFMAVERQRMEKANE